MTETSKRDAQTLLPSTEGTAHFAINASRRNLFGRVMTSLVTLFAIITLLPLVAILITIVTKSFGRLDLEAFTALPPPPLVPGGGFRNAIFGTLITLALGSLISIPVGILAAIYLAEFSRGSRFSSFIRFCTNVLSGVPSIIAGLFAYGVVVLTTGTFSAIAGGVALSVLMLPIVVRTVEEGLKQIPRDIRQGAVALGATNVQTVWQIVLPAALPFVATGVTLALARAAGETAPLLFTALFSQFGFNGPMKPTATLSVLIYNFAISPYKNQQQLAWVAALVIVALILTVSIGARYVARRRVY
ncbi:MAG TPA: phosphate ABC transporter permease PstA [Crinalium sp.]|jgi:phosphate transport system permease protein